MADKNTITRTYKGSARVIARRFARDQAKLARQGYEIENQTTIPGHRGSRLGCVALGLGGFLFRSKDTMIVTWRKRQ